MSWRSWPPHHLPVLSPVGLWPLPGTASHQTENAHWTTQPAAVKSVRERPILRPTQGEVVAWPEPGVFVVDVAGDFADVDADGGAGDGGVDDAHDLRHSLGPKQTVV